MQELSQFLHFSTKENSTTEGDDKNTDRQGEIPEHTALTGITREKLVTFYKCLENICTSKYVNFILPSKSTCSFSKTPSHRSTLIGHNEIYKPQYRSACFSIYISEFTRVVHLDIQLYMP